jgi:hypothetical protein
MTDFSPISVNLKENYTEDMKEQKGYIFNSPIKIP